MSGNALGITTLAISTTFFLLSLLAIGLRVWALHIRGRSWKIHDTLIVTAIPFQIGLITTLFYSVLYGDLGSRSDEVPLQSVVNLFKGFIGQSVTWIFATTTVKLSVLYFYLDIFRFTRTSRLWLQGFIGFVLAYGIASTLCVFTICRPFPKIWNHSLDGRCGNIMNAMFATAVINCIEDLVVVILPLPVIWNLQMSREKKMGLSALIGIGFVIFGINVARLICATVINDSNQTYPLAYQGLFINLEVHLGVINACLPMLKPLFSRGTPTTRTSTPYSGPTGHSGGSGKSENSGYVRDSQRLLMDKQRLHIESYDTELLSRSDRSSSF